MRILITGNMGYVGAVLTKYLRDKYLDVHITGYDTGYFGHCLTNVEYLPEHRVDRQFVGDLRKFDRSILDTIDGVIHLAAGRRPIVFFVQAVQEHPSQVHTLDRINTQKSLVQKRKTLR